MRKRSSVHNPLVFGVLCWLLPVRGIYAQTSADSSAADAAFREALQLMDAGNFAAACPKLEYSESLAKASGTLLNLGDCYEQLGQLTSAFRNFSRAAALSRATGKPERERVARERAEALRGRIALLTVIAPKSQTPGLSISVDGVSIPNEEWGSPYALEPGAHTLDASAPGREPYRVTLPNLSENSSFTADIPELRAPPVTALAAAEVTPAPSSSRFDAQGVAAVVTAGVGVTFVVAGTVFGLDSMSKHDESDRYCSGDVCSDPRGVEAMDAARASGNRATLSFVIGGLGLGAGAVLWFARPFGSRDQKTLGMRVTPSALHLTGTF